MAEKPRPFRPISPGEILQEELEARNWTQKDLAEILDRPVQVVNEIIAGKKAITAETATELGKALGTSPDLWMNLESSYRLDLAHQKNGAGEDIQRRAGLYARVPLQELMKRGWITRTADLDILERDVCSLLGIDRIDQEPQVSLAARKATSDQALNPAQITWACRARQIARSLRVAAFDRQRFEAEVAKLPRLSAAEDGLTRVREAVCSLGVRLVFVEHLPQTYIDGAAFWLDDTSPVVALSLRYDRIDYFWFTLMHELAHVRQKGKQPEHLDSNLVGPSAQASSDKPSTEREADQMASEWLVPSRALQAFIRAKRPFYSKSAILAFAAQIGVHPGIVVGRLHHEGEVKYSHSRAMLVKVRHKLCGSAAGNKESSLKKGVCHE